MWWQEEGRTEEVKFVWCKDAMDWVEPVAMQARSVHIIPDDCEIKSHADGKGYTSKSRYRAELKARGMIELGNERPQLQPKPFVPSPGIQDTLRRVASEKGHRF